MGKWPTAQLSILTSRIMVGIASAATHAYADSGVPMFRNQNIKPGRIDDRDVLYISSDFERLHRNKRLRAGDVVVVRTGYPGVSAVIPKKFDGAQCFTSLIVRPDIEKLDANFLCHFMNSSMGRRLSSAAEAGGAQKNLNAGALETMILPVPPLADQHRIAQILSTWDEADLLTGVRRVRLPDAEATP